MKKQTSFSRRDLIKYLGIGTSGSFLTMFGNGIPSAMGLGTSPSLQRTGIAPIKIMNVKAIGTAPQGPNLVVVKVETSEPGLYGVGCATFTQRAEVVVTAINKYMPEFCIGRDADNIEDMWQAFFTSSYWRNGPVLNNALSGLDQALWDIKAKRANMPLYQLLGGKARFAVDCYAHADGKSPEEVAGNVQKFMDQGFRHVRIQQGGYGALVLAKQPDFRNTGFGKPSDQYMNEGAYLRSVPQLFETVRKKCGEEVELLHDIHERIQPRDAINLCIALEQYRPYFIEDPVSPENMGWFKQLRRSTTVPIAMGELFNNMNEFIDPIINREFDYIRCHVSQNGGITQAMKIARLCEWFNIKTAWHGPPDTSPIGMAVQAHMDLAIWNFGIQEQYHFSDKLRQVFPGSLVVKDGYMYVNDVPGIGVDIDEKEAAKFPISNNAGNWTLRKRDGTIIRP